MLFEFYFFCSGMLFCSHFLIPFHGGLSLSLRSESWLMTDRFRKLKFNDTAGKIEDGSFKKKLRAMWLRQYEEKLRQQFWITALISFNIFTMTCGFVSDIPSVLRWHLTGPCARWRSKSDLWANRTLVRCWETFLVFSVCYPFYIICLAVLSRIYYFSSLFAAKQSLCQFCKHTYIYIYT